MSAQKNLVTYKPIITKADRRELLAQNSKIIWFTGLSGSGKSTIADAVEADLNARGFTTYLLDGDNIRNGLSRNLGFSDEDRTENIRRAGEVAKYFVDAGIVVLCAFISPFKKDRKMVRDMMERDEFIEIFVNCTVDVCEQRDKKGLYKQARAGELKNFTGIDSPYEVPDKPELEVRSYQMNVVKAAEKVIRYILPKLQLSNDD